VNRQVLMLTYAFKYALNRPLETVFDVMEEYEEIKHQFKQREIKQWIECIEYEIKMLSYLNGENIKTKKYELKQILKTLTSDLIKSKN